VPEEEIAIDVDTDDGHRLSAPPFSNERRTPTEQSDNVNLAAAEIKDWRYANPRGSLLEYWVRD
jgi:hypothetical protein